MRTHVLVLLAVSIGTGLLGGCYHTRSLGFVPGEEAIVERETLGRTLRHVIDVDRAPVRKRIRVRLLEVRGITERTRAAHGREERIEITQTWPLPLGWFLSGDTVRRTRQADGLIYREWSEPGERFDVRPVPGQAFEIVDVAGSSRRVTAGDDGWAVLVAPKTPARRILIRAATPGGGLEKAIELH